MPRLQRIPRPGKPAPSLEDRRLARRWFLRRLAIAASRGEKSIVLSTRLAFAIRPMLIIGLGERDEAEQRQQAPRGPAAA